MALINKYYVHVTKESVKDSISASEHPVEKGLSLTDNVKRSPVELSLTGEFVAYGAVKKKDKKGKVVKDKKGNTVYAPEHTAHDIYKKLRTYMRKGKLVKYQGRKTISSVLITDIQTEYTSEIAGGFSFTMTLKEIRVAKKAYVKKKSKNAGTQQVKKNNTKTKYYTVKKGDTLSSIAKKYYGSKDKAKKIYEANKSAIDKRNKKTKASNKYTVYKGMKLKMP